MTYRVVQEKNKFHVVEKDTGLTIAEKNSEKGARDVCRALNLGSGFDGFTPTFFTETFKQKERPSRI